jgi:putative ubiquitin-RnfH superfamily antitoxin RatB of RatAB toxin-antitoxin module
MRIELVYAWPDRYWRKQLELPIGASVADALAAADLAVALGEAALEIAGMAVFSRPVQAGSI